mgnify:CR=1 FL=1
MMSRRTRAVRVVGRKNDEGLTMVLVALTLVIMMVFAAFAIDLGLVYNERRLDQNVADASAMSGGIELLGAGGNLQELVDEVKSKANINLGTNVDSQWSTCTDSSALFWKSNDAKLGLTGGSACISFSSGFDRVRVRLPNQSVSTVFGRVVGVNSFTTNAFAEVGVKTRGSGAFPSAVFAPAQGGDQACLVTGPSNAENCGSPASGQFGSFKPYFYTELSASNPSSQCTSGEQKAPLARAFAEGLDHSLGYFPGGWDPLTTYTTAQARKNGSGCPSAALPGFPNIVSGGGGFDSQGLYWGLVQGDTYDGSYTGRLAQGPYRSTGSYVSTTASIFGTAIDNAPIWMFLKDGIGAPSDCAAASAFTADYTVAKVSTMIDCLKKWVPAHGEIFVDAIGDSQRLTTVPKFAETGFDCDKKADPTCDNDKDYHINNFQPVFFEAMFAAAGGSFTCSSPSPTDATTCEQHAGQSSTWTAPAGQRKVSSVSALIVPCGSLPSEICRRLDPTPPNDPAGIFYSLEMVR